MEIIKRDGRKESFDSIKISNAIRKALISVGEKDAQILSINLTNLVEDRLSGQDEWSVESRTLLKKPLWPKVSLQRQRVLSYFVRSALY